MGNCRFKGNFFLLSCWKCGKYTLFLLKTKKQGMKIVYVYDAIARIGGVERILVDKMNYLAEVYSYEVYLITAAQGMHPFSFPLSDKVKHIDIDARFHVQYQYKFLKRLWMKWKLDYDFKHRLQEQIGLIDPDIVIGTTYYKADVICKLKCRAKKVIESHCAKSYTGLNDGIVRNKIIQWFYNRQLTSYNQTIERKSDVIVALTKGDAAEWNKKENVFVIPNMIKKMPESKSSCEAHRVISAGRLIYQKGYDLLIEAWNIIHKNYPDWKLDIYGEGPLRNELQRQISGNKLNDVITIHSSTPHIFEKFIQSSIYIMSSRFEGFGLVLIEAMSCGLPCISFDCPYGPDTIIVDNKNGILVPNKNIEKLAEAIHLLIGQDNVRHKYGMEAKKNVEKFLPENIMLQWKQLFTEIL